MKLKWIGGEREIPGVGLVNYGSVINTSDEYIAKDLIRQGLAEKLDRKKPKKQITKKERD